MTEDVTQVHIVYTGIIGFHPVRDEQGEIQAVWALAPNGRTDPHHPHEVWLGCLKDQVATENFLDNSVKVGDAIAYLVDGEMSLSNQGAKDLTLWDAHNSSHLVQLKDSHPGPPKTVKLHQNHLNQFDRTVLRWRTRIEQGTLEITYIDKEDEWSFSNRTHFSPLGQEVCHHFQVPGDRLTFTFNRAGSNAGFLTLVSQQGEPIILVIGNTPEDDILITRSIPGNVDKHVKLYNKLARSPSANPLHLKRRAATGGSVFSIHNHGWATPSRRRVVIRRSRVGIGGSSTVVTATGANCPPGWWEESDGG